MKHADYGHVLYSNLVVAVTDFACEQEGSLSSMTVTNDAEYVVEKLAGMYDIAVYPIVYRDSEGNWDQLCVNTNGQFSHFGLLHTTDIDVAVARAVKPPVKQG